MARIRSIHPGLFTDEAYASLPMAARVLLTGLWTDSDDHGVFEWKPLSLKMRVFPADSLTSDDMGELLKALEGNDCIKRFMVDGKAYGAVRSFCKWQRPKKPTYRYPVPHQYRTYVDPEGSTNWEAVPNSFPTASEIPPQRKEEEEEEGGNPRTNSESVERVSPASAKAPPPAATETHSPKEKLIFDKGKIGSSLIGTPLPEDWTPDKALCAKVKADFGMTDQDLASELPAFHALNVSGGMLSKSWSNTFYLFCKRWKEHRDKQAQPRIELSKPPAAKRISDFTETDWDGIVAFYARTGHWQRHAGSDPTSPSCKAPREILGKHGIGANGERPPRKALGESAISALAVALPTSVSFDPPPAFRLDAIP
jgi:hypothetical protein